MEIKTEYNFFKQLGLFLSTFYFIIYSFSLVAICLRRTLDKAALITLFLYELYFVLTFVNWLVFSLRFRSFLLVTSSPNQ